MSQLEIKTAFIDESMSWFARSTADVILLLDKNGAIKYINPSFERILQTNLTLVENKPFSELVYEDDKEKTVDSLLFLQDRNHFIPFTSRWKVTDETYCFIHWYTAEISEDGWIQAIGQLKQRQDKMVSKIAAYRPFIELMENATAFIDNNGRVVLLNSAFEDLFGWTMEEIEGKFMPCIPDQYQTEFNNIIAKVLNGEKVIKKQTLRRKKDGTIIPVNIVVSPLFSNSGEVKALSAVTIDLTELMEFKMLVEMQNESIEVAERLLIDITKNISEVFCLFDLEKGKPIYISPSIEEKWGIKLERFYNNPLSLLDSFHSDDRESIIAFFWDSNNIPRELEVEMISNKKDFSRWIRIEITPITDEKGKVTRHFSFFKDITEIKEKTSQIKQLDQLGIAGQLAAGIAHEIRNPLTAVKGFVQLLSEETNNKYSHIILSEIDRIEFIMNEFLVLAKPQKEMKLKQENLNDVVREVCSFMNPEAILNNVEINMEFEALPLVNCESKQIKQVLINLIKNAIEAMPSGGNIHIHTFAMDNGYASIEVKDEGIGIPKERLERLREPFYSNKEKGTGLGMMISFKIIEDHKGTIQFFSEEGKGTIVQLQLPPAKIAG